MVAPSRFSVIMLNFTKHLEYPAKNLDNFSVIDKLPYFMEDCGGMG